MGPYVTFLLNLAGDGEDRTLADSLMFRPSEVALPKTAFQWKVICDAAGQVFVIAQATGGGYEVIATAKRGVLGLGEQRQLENQTVPTAFQWKLVASALDANLAKATSVVPADGTVVDAEQLARSYKPRKRGARYVPPPPELPSSIGTPRHVLPKRAQRVLIAAAAGAVILAVAVLAMVLRMPKGAAIHDAAPIDAVAIDAVAIDAVAIDAVDPVAHASATMRWDDVAGATETSIAHVLKDWEAERGKKLCVTGTISSIERRDVERRKTFAGRLVTDDGDGVDFVAVGSTGDLVRKRRGTLCGIVTGKLAIVGMFDLPENQLPVVEQ